MIKVVQFQRKPFPGSYSVERLFRDVREYLPPTIQCKVVVSKFLSKGLLRRVFNIIEAAFHSTDVNHVTGDVHFLTLLLPRRRTLLTVLDCILLTELSGWRWWLFWLLWYWLPSRRSAAITVISESTKRQLLDFVRYDAEKISVIYPAVSNSFRAVPREAVNPVPVLLQVGTTKNKNLERVIHALQGMCCHLRIIGPLTGEHLKLLEESRLQYSFKCKLSESEILDEYVKSDVVILVSTYEGFGLPIVEANAVGRLVITSNVLSMPEVAGDAACLVDPFDVQSIRNGILRILEDKQYRDSLIRNGYTNAERFKVQRISAEYCRLYEAIAGSSRI